MPTCSVCASEFAESDLLMTGGGPVCEPCELDQALAPKPKVLTLPAMIGLVAGIAPFFLHFTTGSTETVNGQVVSASHFDFVAVPGGSIALMAGLVAAALGLGKGKVKRIPVGLAICVLGVVQLARGFGIV